jgi:uncharacterized membrane protein HdeD (DUF308 family)
MTTPINSSNDRQEQWLKRYYLIRAAFSVVWVGLALAVGTKEPGVATLLLVAYPAWDAVANWLDASNSGGLARNPTQKLNVFISAVTALAVILASKAGIGTVIAVIGVWAIVSGLLQLGTAVRRWKTHGAQWAMVLSGAQSALAGGLFVAQSQGATPPSIANIAGYAGVGALYFLISGIWLLVSHMRRAKRASA